MNKVYIPIGWYAATWLLLTGHHACQADALGGYMPVEKFTQVEKAWEQIKAGNDEVLKTAAAAGDLEMIWSLYLDAGGNKNIQSIIATQLAAIPGHAQYAADLVETITNTTYDYYKPVQNYGGIMPREYAFRILDGLGALATPEAIQQIGRFLYDDRNPEIRSDLMTGQPRPMFANSTFAVRALNKAVGDKSPIAGKVDVIEMANPGAYSVQVIREWWASDASLPFRQPLPGVALPEIVKNPPKLPHVNLDRHKPRPISPPGRVIDMGPHIATPQAEAEAALLMQPPPEIPHLPRVSPHPPLPAPPLPPQPIPVSPIATSPSTPDAKWLYLLLTAALLLVPVWLAARRKKLR